MVGWFLLLFPSSKISLPALFQISFPLWEMLQEVKIQTFNWSIPRQPSVCSFCPKSANRILTAKLNSWKLLPKVVHGICIPGSEKEALKMVLETTEAALEIVTSAFSNRRVVEFNSVIISILHLSLFFSSLKEYKPIVATRSLLSNRIRGLHN